MFCSYLGLLQAQSVQYLIHVLHKTSLGFPVRPTTEKNHPLWCPADQQSLENHNPDSECEL